MFRGFDGRKLTLVLGFIHINTCYVSSILNDEKGVYTAIDGSHEMSRYIGNPRGL